MDKKRQGDSIKFVLLSEIGRAFVEEVPLGELEAFLADFISS
jgi:3-dehydroquinate synthetase